MQYYYQQQHQSEPRMSGTAKALLAGLGAVAGHRALIGAKRTVLLSKLRKAGFSKLGHSDKLALLKKMNVKSPYKKWLRKQI